MAIVRIVIQHSLQNDFLTDCLSFPLNQCLTWTKFLKGLNHVKQTFAGIGEVPVHKEVEMTGKIADDNEPDKPFKLRCYILSLCWIENRE